MVKKEQMESCEKVKVSREEMQEVDKFNYLGVIISTDGGMSLYKSCKTSVIVERK